MSKAYADRLAHALQGTGILEPVQTSAVDNRINVLCRVGKDQEGPWINLLKNLLIATEEYQKEASGWQSHFCKHYFLKGSGKSEKALVFGWNISVQSNDLRASLDHIIGIVKGASPYRPKASANEIEEFPLVGASRSRGRKNALGKGASTIGGTDDFHPPRR